MMAQPEKFNTTVLEHRQVSATGYVLTLERGSLEFHAGELVSLYGREERDARDYTIASGEQDEHLDILYRYIAHGALTPQLITLRAGDPITLSGPYGNFTVRDRERPIVFIATGTGIAPCRSFARTGPNLDLTVLHGVRQAEDLFFQEEFETRPYYPCVSGETGTGFHGRVTARLETLEFDPRTHFYLCGANEMIYEVSDLLKARGFEDPQLFSEPYYYRHDD